MTFAKCKFTAISILFFFSVISLIYAESAKDSRLFVGEELWQFGGSKYRGAKNWKPDNNWIEMPGSLLGLNYSGRGELPLPLEFTIKLDKKLKMGEYKIFVKNFYRGKMNIIIGNTVKPVKIKRYDWTSPVHIEIMTPEDETDIIVLQYFSTAFKDSGKKQSTNYIIQGVYITNDFFETPIDAGEIIKLKSDIKIPSRKGNYLRDGSFEAGLGNGWGHKMGVSWLLDKESFDSSTKFHGKYSLKVPLLQQYSFRTIPLESKYYLLNPEFTYSLSLAMKASRPLAVTLQLLGHGQDLKNSSASGFRETFKIETNWKIFKIQGKIKALPGNLYSLNFSTIDKKDDSVTLWLDAVQLNENKTTDFNNRDEITMGYLCKYPGHIYYPSDKPKLTLRIYNPAKKKNISVIWQTTDFDNKIVDKGKHNFVLGKEVNIDKIIQLFNRKFGIFRASFKPEYGEELEFVYSVLPENKHSREFYPEGTLGVDTNVGTQGLKILKRANFNWVITKFAARWHKIEPEQGKFNFIYDNWLQMVYDEKIMTLVQILNSSWGTQKWIKPLMPVHRGAKWDIINKNKFITAFSNFSEIISRRYKPWVSHYEIWNEPNCVFTGRRYGEVLKAANLAIKKGNSKAKIIGFSGGGFSQKFYSQAAEIAGIKNYDIISTHFYHNNRKVHGLFKQYLKKKVKPGWNTETGSTCPSMYRNLLSFKGIIEKNYVERRMKSLRIITRINVNNYLMSLSVGGMKKYFYYFARFVNSSPTQPTRRGGSGKDPVEFDGALRGNGVALSIASHFLDGAKYQKEFKENSLEAYIYQNKTSAVGFFWITEEGFKVKLPEISGISWFDIMGNSIPGNTLLDLQFRPVYFRMKDASEDCILALKQLKVRK